MAKIINLTPHSLDIIAEAADGDHAVTFGRGPGARTATVRVVATIPPSGVVAGAREEVAGSAPVIVDGAEVAVVSRRFGAPTNLPEPAEGVTYFVSALTVSAAVAAGRRVDDLLMPGELGTKDGKPFGVLSFARQG